ncbi:hypothetical protein A1O3_03643 [Neofusicoccum parvum]|uniref:Uncharacterized protein n=1 Tax=Neofusicoccum parvum TaxID=310453 RepID=A0ACB5SPT1_9PEZI|nr:hypothetical protein A1O3_03643 [Neofusicoccum parvum]
MNGQTTTCADAEEIHSNEQYSRVTELELDTTDLKLSAKAPKDITEAAHRAVRNSVHRWRTSGDVIHLSHGTFQSKPATLIVFNFRFMFEPKSSNRFSRGEIRLNFLPADGEDGSWPTVRQFGPRLIHSMVTLAEVTSTGSLTSMASVSAGPTPVQIGVEATKEKSVTFPKEYRTEVIGESWTSDEADEEGCEEDDAVNWTLTENKRQADGIPREFRAAVVVQRDAPTFMATVQIRAKTSSGLTLFGWPWSRPSPLLFKEDVSFGNGPETNIFDEMQERHWLELIGIDRPYSRVRATQRHAEKEV